MFFKLNVPNGEGTILLKEELLLPTYAPPEIIHRDAEIKAIAWAIRPLLDGHTADNLFIYGNTGTGKTTSVRHVLSKLQETTSKVLPVRINCWEHNTQMAVYARILEALGSPLPRRGLATDEVFHRIVEVMKREEVAVLVVLDELDSLIHNREEALLYNLSRAGSNGVKFAIIGISNNKDLTLRLDARISSTLRFTSMEFKEYSQVQLLGILQERAKVALFPKVCDLQVLEECASIGASNSGNARLALEVLWKAAVRAETRDAKAIELEDVVEVTKTAEKRPSSKRSYTSVSFEQFDLKPSEDEKLILELLAEGELSSSKLYDAFTAKAHKSKRQIRNYLATMEAKGLIEAKEVEFRANSFLRTKIYCLKTKRSD